MFLELTKSKQLKRAKEVYNSLHKKMWDISQSKSEEQYLPSYMAE